MTKLQRKRLKKLAEHHEKHVKRRGFNMRDFGHCAAHNACGLFGKRSLRKSHKAWTEGLPAYRNSYGFKALGLFFGDAANVAGLFSVYSAISTPKQWARRCRKFLADYDKSPSSFH